jgi:hypothetical protein
MWFFLCDNFFLTYKLTIRYHGDWRAICLFIVLLQFDGPCFRRPLQRTIAVASSSIYWSNESMKKLYVVIAMLLVG